jgi:hypothetical protein
LGGLRHLVGEKLDLDVSERRTHCCCWICHGPNATEIDRLCTSRFVFTAQLHRESDAAPNRVDNE